MKGFVYRLIKKTVPFLAALLTVAGCATSNLADYTSSAGRESRVSAIRTEMVVIKSDDPKWKADFAVVSAVDNMPGGKRNFYIIIAPAKSGSDGPKVKDMDLARDYPYIIEGKYLPDIVSGIEKCADEWGRGDLKLSGSVYNIFITSRENSKPYLEMKSRWWEEKKYFEIYPYIRFNYSRNEKSTKAVLALGTRIEQVVYNTADNKTEKGRITVQEDEKTFSFDSADNLKVFQRLLAGGLVDLRSRGMADSRKTEIVPVAREEKKPETVEEKKVEEKPPVIKKRKKRVIRKRRTAR